MKIKIFTFNPVSVNAYLLWDETNEAVIIDPACHSQQEEQQLELFIHDLGLNIKLILNTHGHFDHLMGNRFASEKWNMDCFMHPGDLALAKMASQQSKMFGMMMKDPPLPVCSLADGDLLQFGRSALKVIHVPGHSPGGVAFYAEKDGILIPGDILFEGSVGRTDLPGGNHQQLIGGIKQKLMVLDADVNVYPGHGSATSIGNEKLYNPFLQ